MPETIHLNRPANITEVSRWKYRFIARSTLSSFLLRNGMAFSSTDVSKSVRHGAAPPSPVLYQPVERIDRKMLYDEIDNLRREKEDLVVERDILLASHLNSGVMVQIS